jgi:simple sugar transport system ATP-binding protein
VTGPVLELRGVEKRFAGVVACGGISLALHPGEIHALLGENGAGKSTLVSLLAGMQTPDAGEIHVGGNSFAGLTPAQALAHGIGVARQHPLLVPTQTVAENLLLGGAGWRRPRRDRTGEDFRHTGDGFGFTLNPHALAGSLTPAEQTQVEIVRALWRGWRVLVLDEPTSALSHDASARVLRRLRDLRESGRGILLITHRLDEALDIAGRITVLRRGVVSGTLGPEELAGGGRAELRQMIRSMMFGDTAAPSPPPLPQGDGAFCSPSPCGIGLGGGVAPTLELAALHAPGLHGISLTIAPGEILGIAGIDGNGQTALAEAIAGLLPATSGSVALDGTPVTSLQAAARHLLGIRYLSDDRMHEGSAGPLPLALNLLLKRIGAPPFWRAGAQQDAAITTHAQVAIDGFDIRAPHPWAPIATLSGGNIQKALLSRELDGAPRLIVWHKPCVGLDAQAAAQVQARIRSAAAKGVASLLISADLEELFALAHRIAVLDRGQIAGVIDKGPGARAAVAALMTQ